MDPRRVAAVVGFPVRCAVVGRATVQGALYDVGEYPALQRSAAVADVVPGVVLEVDDAALARLDDYEGVAEGLYTRELRSVRLDDGTDRDAWVYLYARPVDGMRRIAAWPPKVG